MSAETIRTIHLPGGRIFSVVLADLLEEPVDCIVNAANGFLAHGGGVAGAIAKAAGKDLEQEGESIVQRDGPIPVGAAVVTTAGKLPFKGVIHAVGPQKGEWNQKKKLIRTLQSAFMRATERGWESISFPAVSSGIFAVPIDVCARAYVKAVIGFFRNNPDSSLRIIRLVLFDGPLVKLVLEEIKRAGFS